MTLESQMILIFGATGDLTRRKLVPSLYHLLRKRRLTLCTPIVCIGRRNISRDEYLASLMVDQFIPDGDPEVVDDLLRRVEYVTYDPEQHEPADFAEMIRKVEEKHSCTPNKLIYLALPTTAFGQTANLIGALDDSGGWRRVVFEKPFGQDLSTAIELNENIGGVLREEEIYRVDHYLGKELVQNILTLRFANEIFSGVWREKAIDHVQISVAERLGVEKRSGYYDKSGAVRDMVQNHLLQLLSFVAMEPPADNSPDALRNEAAAVMQQLRPPRSNDVVLGQYGPGSIEGDRVCGYIEEEGVPENSATETYAALRIYIDTPRWRGVPFYLRTGKRLKKRYAEIRIVFKQRQSHLAGNGSEPNTITIRIQPDEGIALSFNVRQPGADKTTAPVVMDFCHHCHFGPNTPEAYESLLYRVMQGDHSLFPRWDWLAASWQYVDSVYAAAAPPSAYVAGSNGPVEADQLLREDGREWLEDSTRQPVISLGDLR